ncbi:MAG: stage II sporulation protein M [Pseudomonadota bacterium]
MTDQRSSYRAWLERRKDDWRELTTLISGNRQDLDLAAARRALNGYRGLARDLSLLRTTHSDTQLARTAETVYERAHEAIHTAPRRPVAELWNLFAVALPAAARRLAPEIRFTVTLFVVTALAGFALVYRWPETGAWFMSREMIVMVQNRTLWTDGLLNVVPSSVLAIELMQNNISVAITAFALGLLYGIGTLYIVVLNGLMLGAIFGYTTHFAMSLPLYRFVIAHGIVELSVICLSAAAGLALGRALARPGVQGRIASLRAAGGDAGALAAVCVPFLIGSGLIEGYLSPREDVSTLVRTAVGVAWFGVLLLALDGRFPQAAGHRLRKVLTRR